MYLIRRQYWFSLTLIFGISFGEISCERDKCPDQLTFTNSFTEKERKLIPYSGYDTMAFITLYSRDTLVLFGQGIKSSYDETSRGNNPDYCKQNIELNEVNQFLFKDSVSGSSILEYTHFKKHFLYSKFDSNYVIVSFKGANFVFSDKSIGKSNLPFPVTVRNIVHNGCFNANSAFGKSGFMILDSSGAILSISVEESDTVLEYWDAYR